MLTVIFILPVVMACVLHGVRQGVMLACFATLALPSDVTGAAWRGALAIDPFRFLPALGILRNMVADVLASSPGAPPRRRPRAMTTASALPA